MGSVVDQGRSSVASSEMNCAHCGLPVPSLMILSRVEPQFCCSGCRTVYGVIKSAGLSQYYDIRALDTDKLSLPASPKNVSYAEFDTPEFRELHSKKLGDCRTIDFYLEGVHCAACVWLVEKLPELEQGVQSVRLDFGRSIASVVYDPEKIELSRVGAGLDRLGYSPHPFRSAERRAIARKEERKLLMRIGIAGAAWGNAMLMAVALYAGAWKEPELANLFRWMSLLVSVPAVLWAGQTFFSGAIAGLRARVLHMDMPLSLAILGATLSSIIHTILGHGDIYFDSVTMLVFLLLTGRWLQMRALRAASDASELLFSLAPSRARLVDDTGNCQEVPIEALLRGQTVEVLAGESVPVDGLVVFGNSRLDTSLLTGESVPVDVSEGTEVHAGASNLSAKILVRVTATGEDTRVGRLVKAVEEAQRRRAPIVMLADRMASYFVFGVLVLSVISGMLWWSRGLDVVVERVIAMLVVTCPCALGLATPLALSHALGLAARSGIFIKGADTIEALTRVKKVFLDKTGTLTQGKVAYVSAEGDESVVESAAALEGHSSHPFAKALVEAFPRAGERHGVDEVKDTMGAGLSGLVDGQRYAIGTVKHLREAGVEVDAPWEERARKVATGGYSPVLVGVGGEVRAILSFGDPLREDTVSSIRSLRGFGLSLGILSGDHPAVVQKVAQQVGIGPEDAFGAVSPEGKILSVEREMSAGRAVSMIGDGVNDAGALAASRVGIAVRGGAELSLATSDVFLTRAGLRPAVELIRGARSTLSVVHRNLAISLVYNIAGAGLALFGLINPLVAAILMPLSSLSVVLSSVLARPFGKLEPREQRTSKLAGSEVPAWR